LIGLGLAYFLSRSVANGVRAVQTVLTSLKEKCATNLERALGAPAEGDLTVEVKPVTRPI
jgi:hypothetical protein